MVATTHTVFVLVRAELGLFLNFIIEKRILVDERCSHERSALDVDMPTGQARCKTGILAAVTDSK